MAKKVKSKPLPKEVFVCRRDEDEDGEWLSADDSLESLAKSEEITDTGNTVRVARYQLVEVLNVSAATVVKAVTAKQ